MIRQKENGHRFFLNRYLRPHIFLFAALFGLGLFSLLFTMVSPIILKIFIDDVLIGKNTRLFPQILFLMIGIYLVSALASFLTAYLSGKLNLTLYQAISRDMVEIVQTSSLMESRKYKTGDLLSRLSGNINSVIHLYTSIIQDVALSIMSVIVPLAVMLSFNVELTFIVIIPVFLIVFTSLHFGRKIKVQQRALLDTSASVTSYLKDFLAILPLIKVFGLNQYMLGKYSVRLTDYYRDSLEVIKTSALNVSLSSLIFGVPMLLAFAFGGSMVISGTMTLGTLVAFMSYSGVFFTPLNKLSYLWTDYKSSSASYDRIREIYSLEPDRFGNGSLTISEGTVEFVDVSFSYDTRSVTAGFSGVFRRGLNYLIGDNGSGKTTLLWLLCRLYNPACGSIYVDRQDIAEVSEECLREKISVVFSDPYLFDGTVMENIRMGRPGASSEDVVRAAKIANVHDFIENLPHRYGTGIGESGAQLSSGERQKIALARAILKDAPILILDEMTRSVDAESKRSMNETIKNLKNKTVIIVTHDASDIDESGLRVYLKRPAGVRSPCL